MKYRTIRHTEYHQQIRRHLREAYLLSDDRIEEVMPRFLGTLESLMQDLEQISQTENQEALNRAGHALKGALLNLGLQKAAAIAFSIEQFNLTESERTRLAKKLAELRREMNKIG